MRGVRRRVLILTALLVFGGAVSLPAWYARDTTHAELEKLATLLDWKPGRTVAEIGAGEGRMTGAVAQRVGPSGRVFTTELDPKRLAGLKDLVARKKLSNVTVIEAGDADTNLPADCCDSIFMRDVYHHFTHPTALNTSIYRALKPGGMLAVIDFPPEKRDSLSPVPGVPESR